MLAKREVRPNLSDTSKLDIIVTCPMCGLPHTVTCANRDYDDWRRGKLIQDAMPYLPVDQREILVTGIDGQCWKGMFA